MRGMKVVAGGVLAVSAMLPATEAMAIYAEVKHRVSGTTSGNRITVKDWHKDNWVKGEYYRRSSAGTKRTLWNKSGKGREATYANGSKIIKLQVCEDRDKAPDPCSGWKA